MTDLLDDVCPRCGEPRGPDQEYCLACGLRLPPTRGRLAGLRRAWVRRVGWYPGDWVWTTLLTLLVAAAGAAVAIATTSSRAASGTASTFAAPTPPVTVTQPTPPAPVRTVDTSTLPTPPEPTTTKAGTPPPAAPNGQTPWPARTGWTVVLESLPATPGGLLTARAVAMQAVRAGLPDVGILRSSGFASLHPGYEVVFTGVYDARDQAQSTLQAAYAAGFSSAYVRQISR